MSKIRLQVFLSRNGVCSRRKAMDVVTSGIVKVNGRKVEEPSFSVDTVKDKITVNDRLIVEKSFEYLMLHKKNYVTTKSDEKGSKTVFDLIPKDYYYLSPVGRLDKDTEGLLLLTNDGDTAYKLTHPSFDLDKVYVVRVLGKLDPVKKSLIEKGVYIDRKRTSKSKIRIFRLTKKYTDLNITIHEGRNRQIRRMFAKFGYKVIYLKRTKQGPLEIGKLPLGSWRELTVKEIKSLTTVDSK